MLLFCVSDKENLFYLNIIANYYLYKRFLKQENEETR